MPDFEPTNSTTAPLLVKSAATHSAGIACPPVPPPAIRILGLAWSDLSGSLTVLRYPVEDAHGGEAYQQTRSTVAHEGERHPGEREDHHGRPDVEGGLYGEHGRQARRDAPRHYRGGVHGYSEAGQRDKAESGDHGDHPDQAEFFPYKGEDHIRAELGDVWSLSARPGSRSEEASGFYGHHGLDHLVAGPVRCGPGVQERQEPLATIRLEHHHPRYGHGSHHPRQHEVPGPQLRGPQRPRHARKQDHGGAEIRFDQDEHEERSDGHEGLDGESRTMREAREGAAQEQYGRELRELRRLNAHGTEVEPPPGAVYLGPHVRYEHQHQAYQDDQVQRRSIFPPCRIPNPARDYERGEPEPHVNGSFDQETGTRLSISRRVDHDEPQQGERQGHQEQIRPQAAHRPMAPRSPAGPLANL